MPRNARIVVPKLPHHVTQRGNKRQRMFFCDADREFFLEKLSYYSAKADLGIASYCLMDNHPHLIVIPDNPTSLVRAFKPLFMCYSQRLNARQQAVGVNWQGRFFSCTLEGSHIWNAFQYVALNPVRAGIVQNPEDYKWASTQEHLGLTDNNILTADPKWLALAADAVEEIKGANTLKVLDARFDTIRRNTSMNLPCGSETWIKALEQSLCRNLSFRPRGRPLKALRSEEKG